MRTFGIWTAQIIIACIVFAVAKGISYAMPGNDFMVGWCSGILAATFINTFRQLVGERL